MIEKLQDEKFKRKDLHCISIHQETWSKAKELAKAHERSVSSLFREIINKEYNKERRKQLISIN